MGEKLARIGEEDGQHEGRRQRRSGDNQNGDGERT